MFQTCVLISPLHMYMPHIDSYPDSSKIVIHVALIEWIVYVVVSFASLLIICINFPRYSCPPQRSRLSGSYDAGSVLIFATETHILGLVSEFIFEAGNWTIGVSCNDFKNKCFHKMDSRQIYLDEFNYILQKFKL